MELTYQDIHSGLTTDGRPYQAQFAPLTPSTSPFTVSVFRVRFIDGVDPGNWLYGADTQCDLPSERMAIAAVVSKLLDLAESLTPGAGAGGMHPAAAPALAPAPAPTLLT